MKIKSKMKKMAGLFTSKSSSWETPQAFFDKLDREFRFQIDVAADRRNFKCSAFLDRRRNALKVDWKKYRCWMNPPYGREIGAFIEKAYQASLSGALVVGLLPARTDTKAFHEFIWGKAEIRFVRGRLKFGGARHNAPFPNMVVIWRPYGGGKP